MSDIEKRVRQRAGPRKWARKFRGVFPLEDVTNSLPSHFKLYQ